MENLKQRIETTQTIVDDASGWNTDYWILNIMRNQVTIMKSLVEIEEKLSKDKENKQ